MISASLQAFRAGDPYEQLITQIIRLESQPKTDIQARLSTTERQKTILGELDSKVSALHSLMESFKDTISNPFNARAAQVPDTSIFTATVTDSAPSGSHDLQTLRTASTDTRISKQYTADDDSLDSWFGNKDKTFTISVAHPIEGDDANRVDIEIFEFEPVGTTDEEILQEIATAINDAMDAAVTAGDILEDERAFASMVNETSDTARLTLRAGKTGFANRVQMSEPGGGSGDLLNRLEISDSGVATGTGGGEVIDIGTSESDSLLNSKFVLDGLTMYRSTNQVDDALTGTTLNLKQVMTEAASFSVSTDTESIKTQVSDFIKKYNDVITHIAGNTMVDGDLQIRGVFAGDTTLRSLRFNMRNDMATQVTGQPNGAISYLTEMGIEIANDGTLSIADEEEFADALESDPSGFKSLFTGTDGIASRLETRLESYLGADGLFDNRIDVLDGTIKRYNDQVKAFDVRMGRREDNLRQQYARLQEAMALFQGQSQTLSGFYGY